MNFKTLISQHATTKPVQPHDISLIHIPSDGNTILNKAYEHLADEGMSAFVSKSVVESDLRISSYPDASSVWFADRAIKLLIWEGDLVINGDLIDDDFSAFPMMLIRGDLKLENWLRGGMHCFIEGNLHASGCVMGHYNDSCLFVGGDLHASAFIPCIKPFPDFPGLVPHQVKGALHARVFDNLNPTDEELNSAFVSEVFTHDEDTFYLDYEKVFARSRAGLDVWLDLNVSMEKRIRHLLTEIKGQVHPLIVEQVAGLLSVGEYRIAVETLCELLCEDHVVLASTSHNALLDIAKALGVDYS